MVWLNIPDVVTTIMAGDVKTSRQIYISFFFCATGTSGNCSDVSVKIFSGVMLTNAETLLSHVRSTPRYHT